MKYTTLLAILFFVPAAHAMERDEPDNARSYLTTIHPSFRELQGRTGYIQQNQISPLPDPATPTTYKMKQGEPIIMTILEVGIEDMRNEIRQLARTRTFDSNNLGMNKPNKYYDGKLLRAFCYERSSHRGIDPQPFSPEPYRPTSNGHFMAPDSRFSSTDQHSTESPSLAQALFGPSSWVQSSPNSRFLSEHFFLPSPVGNGRATVIGHVPSTSSSSDDEGPSIFPQLEMEQTNQYSNIGSSYPRTHGWTSRNSEDEHDEWMHGNGSEYEEQSRLIINEKALALSLIETRIIDTKRSIKKEYQNDESIAKQLAINELMLKNKIEAMPEGEVAKKLHNAANFLRNVQQDLLENIPSCPICLNVYKDIISFGGAFDEAGTQIKLACEHVLCMTCYAKLTKEICPICRQSLNTGKSLFSKEQPTEEQD
jgi:Zinc finger, C3HC4 type (RING finger)